MEVSLECIVESSYRRRNFMTGPNGPAGKYQTGKRDWYGFETGRLATGRDRCRVQLSMAAVP